jgi:hypothetical protein
MSVQSRTRAAVSSRWIRAAVAALFLASGATLLAQEQKKEEEKKPAPSHKTTPQNQPKENNNRPPSTPPNAPPRTPSNPPPARPQVGERPAAPNGRPPAPNDRPAPRPGFGAPGGGSGRPAASAPPVFHGRNGSEVHYGPTGRPQMVRAGGYTITHGPSGVARAEFRRPDGAVIVTQGSHYGYVQRNYVVNNTTYVQRTYVIGGVSRAYVYRPYVWGGVSLHVYVAPRFYPAPFYTWAYNPWARPVAFSFGWAGTPWFGFYAGYFTPYPVYAGPAYWLTDYMVAMSLQEAYQAQAAAAAQAQANAAYAGQQPALTPDVKQAIADEVQRQLNEERAQSQAPNAAPTAAPDFLADNTTHVFVVANGINAQTPNGECALTEGDVIQMTAPPPPNSASASLAVLAGKGQDCSKGSIVTVAIADLQEMQNHMRETLDQGLAELQSKQGQGGIPAEPVAAQAAPVQPVYAAAAPPPDPNIASEVAQQAQSAQQAESDVLQQAQSGPSAAGGAPASVSLGMTIDQVTQLLGQPQMVGDLGSKKIYSYGTMKVIFVDGKVSDIQ